MKRKLFQAAVVALSLSIAIYAFFFLLIRSNHFHGWLTGQIKQQTGYELTLEKLRLKPPFLLVASTLSISRATIPMFQADQVTVTLSPIDLFAKTIHRVELEKPVLHLDLHEILNVKSETKTNLAIRHLTVKNGIIVLKTAEGKSLDFRDITMVADNLNLGAATGVTLNAELPWVQGSGAFLIRGNPNNMEADIRIRQQPEKSLSLLHRQAEAKETLQLHATLRVAEQRDMELSVSGKFDDFALETEKITGDFDSRAEIDPDFKSVAVTAKLHLPTAPPTIGGMTLNLPAGTVKANLTANFSVPEKIVRVKQIHIDSPAGVADGSATLKFNPEPSVASSNVKFHKVPVSALKPFLPPQLGNSLLNGWLEGELSAQGPWNSASATGILRGSGMKLRSEIIAVQELAFKAPIEFSRSSLRAGDIQAQAQSVTLKQKDRLQASAETLTVDGKLDAIADEPVNFSGRLKLAGGHFATPENDKVGESFSIGGLIGASISRADQHAAFTAKLIVDSGELLWGKFFGDLKTQKPSFEFNGEYFGNRDEVQLRQAHVNLASVGNVNFSGAIERMSQTPLFRLEAHGEEIQPAGAFEFFIRETFNRSLPILDKVAVSGRLGFALQARGTFDALTAQGTLNLKAGSMRAKSNDWQIGPLDLALPFRLQLNAPPEPASAAPQIGTLTLEAARFGSASLTPIHTSLSLWDNSLRFHQPIGTTIFGGTLEINNLVWRDLIHHPADLSFSMEMKNLQLLKLTESLGWYRFGGSLSGAIPRVESVGNSLKSQGEIQLNVFDGKIRVGKMEVENAFSPLPSIKLDARVEELNLEQASETFEFGQISGILDGTVEDLVIAAGQPSQFKADFHTVEKAGVSQRISVESLNKITVLSSGSDSGTAYGGIAGLFDNFRYSKLGFKAALKNDKLTLRGIESQGDQEYLVVGSFLPPTVNIISHIQEISFGELLRRLEQMRKADKPQIK